MYMTFAQAYPTALRIYPQPGYSMLNELAHFWVQMTLTFRSTTFSPVELGFQYLNFQDQSAASATTAGRIFLHFLVTMTRGRNEGNSSLLGQKGIIRNLKKTLDTAKDQRTGTIGVQPLRAKAQNHLPSEIGNALKNTGCINTNIHFLIQ